MVSSAKAVANLSRVVTNKFDIFGLQKHDLQIRTAYLWEKYRDQRTVEALLAGQYWVGQHAEQLKDALGPPESVDHKNMVTRRREVWKYYATGVNRYRLRITLDDGFVSTWDSKDT